MINWVEKNLNEVCELITCGVAAKPQYVSDGIPFLSAKNVKDGKIIWSGYNCVTNKTHNELTKNNKPLVGDILYTRVGSYGEAAVIEDDIEFSVFVSLTLIKVDKRVLNSYYLKHYLNSDFIKRLAKKSISGSGVGNLNVGTVRNFPILLPPLSEQQRIVAILDEAFAAIAKAKANAEQNLKNAKELFESYLQGVFENKGDGWEEKTLGEIAFVKSGGTPSRAKKEYWQGNIAWYSSGELNDLYTKDPERQINELAINNSNAKIFPKGSLLIGMYDTAALKMSIIERDATFNQAIAGVKPNDKIDLIFILHSINSIKPDLLNLRRGVRQKNLSLEKIKNIPIFLPTIKEQKTIVQKLDALSTETKKLEAIYQQKINDLEELKKSVLQKAFSGELKTAKALVL
ncbi:restriction endonuclease subunit S [uncultured Flavobacterium sp.]|uniref:restriction endonuclease subunit S n=1 Tax=uncultured Flavobacterium sp. TaxID=165435 RepID=UPI0030EBE507